VLNQGQDPGQSREGSGWGAEGSGWGSARVRGGREGGQGGSTKLSGDFKGDMHEVPGYPLHEERGRLGVGPRSGVMPPQGPKSHPRGVSGWGKVRPRRGVGGGRSGGKDGRSCQDSKPPMTKEAEVMEGGQKYAPGDGRGQ